MKGITSGTERGRGRPKKGEEHNADALLAAALECFVEQGFDKASLRGIAKAAGVDVALISYRYGSKLGLWSTIVESVAVETVDRIRLVIEAARSLPPNEQKEHVWREIVDQICLRPQFSRLLMSEIVVSPDEERTAMIAEKLARPIFEILHPFLQEGEQAAPARPAIDLGLAIFGSLSMISLVISTQGFFGSFTPAAADEIRLRKELKTIITRLWV